MTKMPPATVMAAAVAVAAASAVVLLTAVPAYTLSGCQWPSAEELGARGGGDVDPAARRKHEWGCAAVAGVLHWVGWDRLDWLFTRVLAGRGWRSDPCFPGLSFPEDMAGAFLPPVPNCSFCAGVTQVARESADGLDPRRFAKHYAFSSAPVVVTGAAVGWPAMHEFSYDFFRQLYLGVVGAGNMPRSLRDCNYFQCVSRRSCSGRWYHYLI